MFRFFETRINPYPKGEPTTPPRKLLPFLLHYSRPLLPWLLAMSVLTGVISALEITFFDYMGQLVDWMGSTGRDSFLQVHGQKLLWMGVLVLVAYPLLVLVQSLIIHQTIFGNYPMIARWLSHRYLLRQSVGFFQDEFAGRISQKVMQTALSIRETVMKLMDVFVYVVVYFVGTVVLVAQADIWLVLPLVALCSSNLLADTVEGAPQALHLLDYIGADYPQSVEAGNVINESEYREQLEFAKVLQGLVAAMPDKPEKAGLEQGVSALQRAIAARQDGVEIARQARQLGAKLAVAYEVSQAPIITPDPTRGAPLYAQHCSVCHGDAGAGDGPAGVGLTPPPANLRDAQRLDRLSLYAIYNTLGMGVEGTDMPAFADQLDDRQRWDLATYIASFSADPTAAASEKTYDIAELARQTPAEVLAAEGPQAAMSFRAQRAQPSQVKRGPGQLLDYTATTLDKSLAAYRTGDHDQEHQAERRQPRRTASEQQRHDGIAELGWQVLEGEHIDRNAQ
mgnify:CR=1 FL=1